MPMPADPAPGTRVCIEIRVPFTWLDKDVARRFAGAPDQPPPVVEAVAVYRVRSLLHPSGYWHRVAKFWRIEDR